jgi:hypothetical protein
VKRISLAALLACAAFAFARADDGAYHSLIGMARSAKSDSGPDAGAIPDRPSAESKSGNKDVPAGLEEASELRDAVAQPPAPKPRLWTRLTATLLPSWRRPPAPLAACEPAVSTAAARGLLPLPALMPPPDSESVKAGERRGLAELLSATSASTSGQ